MKRSMETQYDPPGRRYANPNVSPDQHVRLYGDKLERHSSNQQIDCVFDLDRFDETNQESTSRPASLNNILPLFGNDMCIVDTFCIDGQDIDIWKIRYTDAYLNSPFVVVEQLFYYLTKPNSYDNFWRKLNSGEIQLELFQLHFHNLSALRRIKISGTSGAVFDECILFESMSKEIVYKSEDSLMLLYLDDVLHFLTCLSEDLKVGYQDIMEGMSPILKKYMNNL